MLISIQLSKTMYFNQQLIANIYFPLHTFIDLNKLMKNYDYDIIKKIEKYITDIYLGNAVNLLECNCFY